MENISQGSNVSQPRGRRYPAKLKFQAVLEYLKGEKQAGEVARIFGIHPKMLGLWKKMFLEKGHLLFEDKTQKDQYERQIEELQRMLEKKEVEIELLKKFLGAYNRHLR